MKPLITSTALLIALVAFPLAGAAAVAQDRAIVVPPYTIVDLGTLGGPSAVPSAVNVFGAAVGVSETSTGANHATLWTATGRRVDLDPTGGDTFATSINAAGTIGGRLLTGGTTTYGRPFEHAVVWSHGALSDLSPGDSFAEVHAINGAGAVAGYVQQSESVAGLAIIGRAGHPNRVLSSSPSSADAINDRGAAAGSIIVGTGIAARIHAALWTTGGERDLGTLPGFGHSFASAIDIENRVIGYSMRSDSTRHAFLWSNGRMVDLGTPDGSTGAQPLAMNNADQAVGFAWGSPPYVALPGGWIWRNGSYESVDRLLPPGSSWTELTPRGLNDLGQIVGYGRHNGGSRPFLLSPPPQEMAGNLIAVVRALDVRSPAFRRDVRFLLDRVPGLMVPRSACAWLEGFANYVKRSGSLDRAERLTIGADVSGLETQALKCITLKARTAPTLIVDAFARRGETRTFTVRTRRPMRLAISVAAPTNAAARLSIKGLPGRIAAHGATTTLVTAKRLARRVRFRVSATRLSRTTPVVISVGAALP